jgi:ADP-ribosylglycohydrolase
MRRSYSDDGAMTLALAQSFIDSEGAYNHELSIQYFCSWLADGRFSTTSYAWDVGISTRLALETWRKHGTDQARETQRLVDRNLSRENRSGNGSLMRIATMGVMLWTTPLTAQQLAIDQGSVTHPAPACREACAVYTDLMCRVMRGWLPTILPNSVPWGFPLGLMYLANPRER